MKNIIDCNPLASSGAVISGEKYRITILTDRLLRLEYSPNGNFEDGATKRVVNRNFSVPDLSIKDSSKRIIIKTKALTVKYDKQPFSSEGLTVILNSNGGYAKQEWHYGEKIKTLKGTTRTLDEINGETELSDGIISRSGFGIIDDTDTMIINKDGSMSPVQRESGSVDLYLFAYGRDYKNCIRDFYKLSGNAPMLPRYAFGNWWSRYHCYDDKEYLKLMDKFDEENIPISVSVIDMDWHLTDADICDGSGWTGFTWNNELFPDHKAFLNELKSRGKHITMNLHPKEGIGTHEACYSAVAKQMNDTSSERIEFDLANDLFVKSYFEQVIKPLEDEGIDFWWIDWQQKGGASKSGYDILFMLNHLHYLDNAKEKRPLILSRYPGIGGQRYPIGFSGDNHITWESLNFQPYFTAVAANVGFPFWSHDIGGHMAGYFEPELLVRWIQFGVMSPIMRLHSAMNPFISKEPWDYEQRYSSVIGDFMRLRNRMIPYLYSLNFINHTQGIPMIRPLYHDYPMCDEAYEELFKNEYLLGDNVIVCPITSPADNEVMRGSVNAWLPSGTWYDLMNGRIYKGDRKIKLWRTLSEMPILAKAGVIIPFAGKECECELNSNAPEYMEVNAFVGCDGAFDLYEDNGKAGNDANYVITKLELKSKEGCAEFIKHSANDECGIIPKARTWHIRFYGIISNDLECVINGIKANATCDIDRTKNATTITVNDAPSSEEMRIIIKSTEPLCDNRGAELYKLLFNARIDNNMKERCYNLAVKNGLCFSKIMGNLRSDGMSDNIIDAIYEILKP